MFDRNIFKATEFKTPTIVVGNLSVGGTGKTPQIEYLIRLLQENYKVAVLSRGYKRKSKGFLLANELSTASLIGDEPFQFFKKFPTIIVCVDENRVNGIQQLEKLERAPDVILLDDAFQHRKVKGGCNILLTPYSDLYVDDCMLPTGNLREGKKGAKRAQLVVVTKCPDKLSLAEQTIIEKKLKLSNSQHVFFTSISYDDELKGNSKLNLKELKDLEIVLLTGIANPKPLVQYLKMQGIQFNHLKYPDHHHFSEKDINHIKNAQQKIESNKKVVLTTEKDYVRIFDKLENVYYISIKTIFINHQSKFDNRIKKYVG